MIKLETKFVKSIDKKQIIKNYQPKIDKIISDLKARKCLGVEKTGWINYWNKNHNKELNLMVKKAKQWQQMKIKDVVVIGIGGSYLGVKAGVDMLSASSKTKMNVHWLHNMNQNYLLAILKKLQNKKFAIIVISKSGTTLEPAIAFNLFRNKLIAHNENAKELIVAVTDRQKGTLHDLAVKNKWTTLIIPDDIGGRYSALTPVGMYLFILLGFDYKQIIKGASDASKHLLNKNLKTNNALTYACYRHYLKINQNNQLENFIVYDPSLQMVTSVYQQLFGESEGKGHKALYPVGSLFTTDLHSIGQYLQDGTRNFFETTLYVKQPVYDLTLKTKNSPDNLSYLNNMKLSYINQVAFESTVKAHAIEGNVDNLIIYVDKNDAYHFGYLYMFLCFAAMTSAYLLGVNPFDQPGVEIYKKRISNILKK